MNSITRFLQTSRITFGKISRDLPHPLSRPLSSDGRPSILAAVILHDDQLTVPSEQTIRVHQGFYVEEPPSPELLGTCRESSILLLGKAERLPASCSRRACLLGSYASSAFR